MNVFTAIGRVGKDAVTRFTQGGRAVTGWSLAVDKGWGDRKETVWLDCRLWGERGERVAQYITKGAPVGVTGELGTREHDGKTYITLDVREVTLLGDPSKRAEEKPNKPQRSAPAAEFEQDADIPF